MAIDRRLPAGLRGCRVLDLAGPSGQYCGKLLADLGADVIKIEPTAGDAARRRGPFQGDEPDPERSLFFAYYNTSKRSLAVDLESEDGAGIFQRLVAGADVIVETPALDDGPFPRLEYETLAAAHPRLILTTLSGFGAEGPYASYRATSLVIFAMSGMMKGIGPAEGPPAGLPGQMVLDLAAVDAAAGTLLALLVRQRTGRGQHVEVAAHEVMAMQLGAPAANRSHGGRSGHLHLQLAPSGVYQCRDGAVEFTTIMPGQWQRLRTLLADAPELQRPEWDDRDYRLANGDRLYAIVADAVQDRTMAELTEQAQQMQIPCLPVNTMAGVMQNEHFRARGFFREIDSPQLGRHAIPGAPYNLSEERWALRRPAPSLGQDTVAILQEELGYSPADVARLQDAEVIVSAPVGRG